MESAWKEAKSINTINAYEDFVSRYGKSKYAGEAKSRRTKLQCEQDWEETKKLNTITSYSAFLNKYPTSEQATEARNEIRAIKDKHVKQAEKERNEDWIKTKETNTVVSYNAFLTKYPTSPYTSEINKKIEVLNYEDLIDSGSSEEMYRFLKEYPKSEYRKDIREKLAKMILSEAEAAGKDDVLLKFIAEFIGTSSVEIAINKLQAYSSVNPDETILWTSIPSVTASGRLLGSSAAYTCGINFQGFSKTPSVGTARGSSSMQVGSDRYFKPGTAGLYFDEWTEFDGLMVLGYADISESGLVFSENSIILKND